jgi:hypothetical protein
MAIIAILAGLILPAVQSARESANRAHCGNNLRQLGLAAHQHHDQFDRLPPGIGLTPLVDGSAWGHHFFHLLPFLEQSSIYDSALGSVALPTGPTQLYFPGNNQIYTRPLSAVLCPSDPSVGPDGVVTINGISWGASCYAVNSQAVANKAGGPEGRSRIPADFGDGTSNTILYAEKYARCSSTSLGLDGANLWGYCASKNLNLPPPMDPPFKPYHASFAITNYFANPIVTGPLSKFQVRPTPYEGACDPTRAATSHAGGMLVAAVDGSVRTLAPTLSGDVWWAAVTPEGNEVRSSDW